MLNDLPAGQQVFLVTGYTDLRRSIEKKDISALSAMMSKSDKEKLRKVLADKELMAKLKSAGSPEEVLKMLGGMK